jgi:hypothetical protein
MARVLQWTRRLLCENSKFYRWHRGRLCEKSVQKKSIAQRSQRPQRGDWGGWPKFYRWHRGRLYEKSGATESIAQRPQRPQRGIWGGWPNSIGGIVGRLCEKSGATEKHRTEVAEGDWVWWSKILSATGWAFGRELIKRNGQSIVECCSGTRSMRKCKSPHSK